MRLLYGQLLEDFSIYDQSPARGFSKYIGM